MSANPFARQVDTLLHLGYHALFGLDDASFAAALAPLLTAVPPDDAAFDPSLGSVPFVIVIDGAAASAAKTLPLVVRRGKGAIERLHPKTPADFVRIPEVAVPSGDAYLLVDVERGADTRNVTPDAAYGMFAGSGRSPLTIAEGIALLTHHPEFLQPNHGFSLLASRSGDKRVPALWFGGGRPKLGWCWGGNPHTWLGSASCARRSEAVALGHVPTP